jgi:hypothetical protein
MTIDLDYIFHGFTPLTGEISFFSMTVISCYIAATLIESRARPLYIVSDVISLNDDGADRKDRISSSESTKLQVDVKAVCRRCGRFKIVNYDDMVATYIVRGSHSVFGRFT